MPRLLGMDVFFMLNGVTFVWNEEKARINPSNHDGTTFQQAVEAFFDAKLTLSCPLGTVLRLFWLEFILTPEFCSIKKGA
ncbi:MULTISPECIES: hypothetical protein [unclassified Nostoc]|uniref:hypothetical protein n=1 Tax=unclassified Nostoc TaxID=2593658 RepID=UPI0025F37243|nr:MULTISPECIES: hypothetical protein [unclassified Nostoc]